VKKSLKATSLTTIKIFLVPLQKNNFSLVEDYRDDIPQVSSEENGILTSIFTEQEVKAAIF
jgi:hypothetical protein